MFEIDGGVGDMQYHWLTVSSFRVNFRVWRLELFMCVSGLVSGLTDFHKIGVFLNSAGSQYILTYFLIMCFLPAVFLLD